MTIHAETPSSSTAAVDPSVDVTRGPSGRRAAVAVTAAVGAAATWLAGNALGADLVIDPATGQQLDLATVTVSTLLAGLAGWAGLALLERFTRRALLVWTVLASVIALSSFGPVFAVDGSAGTTAVLIAWHVVAGLVIIVGLRATARSRS